MWRNILLLALMTSCLAVSPAYGYAPDGSDKKELSAPVFVPTSFDYDYGMYDERQAGVNDRPLVRYWNNFMRNLRIPIPTIQWNMSSPLVSLFTGGTANAVETPVADYDATSSNRRKRKKIISSKNRQRPFDYESLQNNAVNGVNQQLLLPATIAAGQTVHFVDPKTGQYYEVVQDQESYYNNYYQPAHNYYEGPEATPQPIANKAETLDDEEDENDSKEEEVEPSDNGNLQHDERNISEQQDDEYRLEDDDADIVAAATNEVGEQHMDDDDDVGVVANIDDDDESEQQLRVTGNVERMRSAMGTYNRADRRYRKRHRNKTRDPVVRAEGTTKHRGTRVRYFILNTW